jgi:hypothetical protein
MKDNTTLGDQNVRLKAMVFELKQEAAVLQARVSNLTSKKSYNEV